MKLALVKLWVRLGARLYGRLNRDQKHEVFRLGARRGVHVTPPHYYSPLPDVVDLEKRVDQWAVKSEMPGVAVDLDAQAENLQKVCAPYEEEYRGNPAYVEAVEGKFGPGYGYVEAQALHGVIRSFKPRRVVEVGSGASTWCMLKALEANAHEDKTDWALTCIEPFPGEKLKGLVGIELVEKPVQEVPFEAAFSCLEENDLLFIDSSHTVKTGGDVNYLILEVLPRLKPGVILHFHDVYLPYDYQPDALETYCQWAETSLLRAFLTHNERAEILFCQSHLYHERPEILKEVFPEYEPRQLERGLIPAESKGTGEGKHFPASIYIRTL